MLVCLGGRLNAKFVNLLLLLGYQTIEDIAAMPEGVFSGLPGCGAKTLAVLRGTLRSKGLDFVVPEQRDLMPSIMKSMRPRLELVKS